jgi:hypothetical protein
VIADPGCTEVTRSRIGERPSGWQAISEPSVKSPVTAGVNQRLDSSAVDSASNTNCRPASMLIRWASDIM